MIFRTAYDTIVCKKIDNNSRIKAIRMLLVNGLAGKDGPCYIINSNAPSVQPFNQAIIMEDDRGRTTSIVDMRDFISVSGDNINVTNRSSYDMRANINLLSYIWALGGQANVFRISDKPIMIFAEWISQALVKTYGVMEHARMIQMLSAIYYIRLHHDHRLRIWDDEDAKLDVLNKLSKTYGNMNVKELLERMEQPIETFEELYQNILNFTGSKALEGGNVGTLISILSRTFAHQNRAMIGETISVATEHPPTFLALIERCYVDQYQRKTPLGTIVDRYLRNDKTFKLQFDSIIRDIREHNV